MADADNLTQQRLDKLQRLRAAGINPYPASYHRTHTCEQAVALLKELEETDQTATGKAAVNVAGRIMGRRKMG
jgi:lysyl-tRNA synthetase class 2